MHPFDLKQTSAEAKVPPLRRNLSRWLTGTEKKADVPAKLLYLRESDFLKEETFREVLFFERKRAERSQKKVWLMLLELNGFRDAGLKCSIARHVAQALNADGTGISLSGWYKQDAVIGALLTGKNETEKETLREKIINTLPPAASGQGGLKIVFHSFPASRNGHADAEETIPVFYPERKNREVDRRFSLFIKRAVDIVAGIAAIFLFSPFFITIPLLIKATSKGPVLFRQQRIGRNGAKFVFLKFRTMSVDNDPTIHQEYIKNFIREKKSYDTGQGKGLVYKIKDDPRVTPIGRFLRKTSLDELPQFFNVLKGEMSLVGPRPPIPYELDNYELWHLRRVMEIKPGITGLWQVKGRSSTTFDEMVRLDLKYAKEWSLWLDFKLLLKTPWVVIAGKGAY